ncbi:hypothetical protein HDU96_009279 [Phlyctochytrium bullatum]|nr:hypothetical protein HDU96_009279 [Phlyctochytrium bullatum]
MAAHHNPQQGHLSAMSDVDGDGASAYAASAYSQSPYSPGPVPVPLLAPSPQMVFPPSPSLQPSAADLLNLMLQMQERHHQELQQQLSMQQQQHQQQMALQQQQHQQQLHLQQQQLNLQQQKLMNDGNKMSEFRIPSISPPVFKGETIKKKARDAQATITNYLDEAERLCRNNNLRGDGQPIRYKNHLTYVQWLESGLKDHAAERWRKLEFSHRVNMTFAAFKDWIQKTFSSPLSFQDAMRALTKIQQFRSCQDYVEEFDHLTRAVEACGIILQEEVLIFFFMEGLKDHLHQSKDLFDIKVLRDLQNEALRLDRFYWETRKKGSSSGTPTRKSTSTSTSTSTASRGDPMDVSNVEGKGKTFLKLTKEEKEEFKRQNRCSFCRQSGHTIDNCQDPRKKSFRPKSNNVEATPAESSYSSESGEGGEASD